MSSSRAKSWKNPPLSSSHTTQPRLKGPPGAGLTFPSLSWRMDLLLGHGPFSRGMDLLLRDRSFSWGINPSPTGWTFSWRMDPSLGTWTLLLGHGPFSWGMDLLLEDGRFFKQLLPISHLAGTRSSQPGLLNSTPHSTSWEFEPLYQHFHSRTGDNSPALSVQNCLMYTSECLCVHKQDHLNVVTPANL